ncbi:GDP-L-fucose synthase [Patescibacteria group bacterium]|nr:GDP-L-fucose synthase [Patescibacteria group bacterium]
MNRKSSIYLAGHTGLVGSAILRHLHQRDFTNLLYRTHQELELTDQHQVERFFAKKKPEYVIVAAAKIGGIKANVTYPFEFMYENLAIQNNLIVSSLKHGVKKLLYLSCGCAYPTRSKQPIREDYLLTGVPEPTNEGFALAKIVGVKLCEKIYSEYGRKFISCIPANTYGVGDHFEESRSHVIPALIKKFHQAKLNRQPTVTLWGTGMAEREFMYVDDLAAAIVLLMQQYDKKEVINIGSEESVKVKDLANLTKTIVGYQGKIAFDTSKPDGMMKRILDSSKIKALGFKPKVKLAEGLKKTYRYYLQSL